MKPRLMWSLAQFEDQLPAALVARGKEYLATERVGELQEQGNDEWAADVYGTNIYRVNVLLTDGRVADHFCDCPYDGKICKHVVAVLFAIREEQETTLSRGEQQTVTKKRRNLKKLVRDISLEEYRQFVLDYAARNKTFKADFELYFAGRQGSVDADQQYADLAKQLIRKYARQGFIDYRANTKLAKELAKLVATGKALLAKGNVRDAYSLATGLLPSFMDVITQSDDSNGYLQDAVHGLIGMLDEISVSPETSIQLKQELFAFTHHELQRPVYHEWGNFNASFFPIFVRLALLLGEHAAFLKHIDEQLALDKGSYTGYRRQFLLTAKADFLQETGHTAEAKELVDEHLDIPEIRQRKVDRAIGIGDFAAAKALINEGIQQSEKAGLPGVTVRWEEQFFRIARLENDVETLRQIGRKLAFGRNGNGIHSEYYNGWKTTYTPEEWTTVIEDHIAAVSKKSTDQWETMPAHWRTTTPPLLTAIGAIFIEEGYWDRFLAAVQKENRLEVTQQYLGELALRYPDELIDLYIPQLEHYAELANNRGQYAELARMMKYITTEIPQGKNRILDLARRLLRQYPFRPAMQGELNKLLVEKT